MKAYGHLLTLPFSTKLVTMTMDGTSSFQTMSQNIVSSQVESETLTNAKVTNSLFSYFDDFVGLILVLFDSLEFVCEQLKQVRRIKQGS